MTQDNVVAKIMNFPTSILRHVAIVDSEKSITYQQLKEEVKQLATYLLSMGVHKEDKIFIVLDRGIEYIIAILGILQAGACYVPFDNIINREEILECFQESQGKYIITENDNIIKSLPDKTIRYKDAKLEYMKEFQYPEIHGDDLAYIIFTSGTTGMRKGVMIEHKSLYNLVFSLNEAIYNFFKEPIRVGVIASFTFDSSIKQIFYALYYGHTLVIAPDTTKYLGRNIINFINYYSIQAIDVTPSLINLIKMDQKRSANHMPLTVLIGGEILTKSTVENAYECFGENVRLFNMYGPTECCVDVATFEVTKEWISHNEQIPIGTSLHHVELEIHQPDMNGIGELLIRGIAVGRGYTNYEQGFSIENGDRLYYSGDMAYMDEHGYYYILGRKDSQIKLRGYRLELEGIDACIKNIKGVSFSYTLLEKMDGREVLASFVKSDKNDSKMIVEELRKRYSAYMIPNYIIMVDDIIVNKNGKVDCQYYKQLFHEYIKDKYPKNKVCMEKSNL